MTRSGLGDCVILAGVVEERGLVEQTAKPSGELAGVSRQVIRTKLIDDDHDDEREVGVPFTGPGLLCRRRKRRPETEQHAKTSTRESNSWERGHVANNKALPHAEPALQVAPRGFRPSQASRSSRCSAVGLGSISNRTGFPSRSSVSVMPSLA